MQVLLERKTAGLDVSVNWEAPGTRPEAILLIVIRDDEYAFTEVPPEKALDAFDHPALYFSEDWKPLFDPPRSSA